MTTTTTILAIGDPHFKSENSIQTDRMASEIIEIIQNHPEIDAVVVLGDILHRHDRIDLHCLKRAVDFLASIRKQLDKSSSKSYPRPLWVLIGNHDRPNNTTFLTNEHAFGAVSRWRDTVVVADSVVVEEAGESQHLFALVPYVPPGRFEEALGGPGWATRIVEKGERISGVFAHQEFRGAKMGAIFSTEGDIYPPDAPVCVSGHIHDEQWVGSNVHYPGTPYEIGWWNPKSGGKGGGDWGVSIYAFGGGGGDGQRSLTAVKCLPLKTVPKNVMFTFETADEFLKDDVISTTTARFPIGSRIKVRVKCKTSEEIPTSVKTRFSEELGIEIDVVIVLSDSAVSEEAIITFTSFPQRLATAVEQYPTKDVKDYLYRLFPQMR